jgi:hypothetical protein
VNISIAIAKAVKLSEDQPSGHKKLFQIKYALCINARLWKKDILIVVGVLNFPVKSMLTSEILIFLKKIIINQ